MRTPILSLALLLSGSAWAQVQKCTMPDGKVAYSDIACPKTSQQSSTLIKAPAAAAAARLPPPDKVMFSGTPQTDYIKAAALMDNIRIVGRDCEWALKVDNTKIQRCVEFMGKLQPGGEFVQVSDRVSELNEDAGVARQSMGELRTITRHMEDIVRYKEFMLANLGVKSAR